MRSHGKGSLSAAMRKREGVEPRNYQHCTGSRSSFSGNQYQYTRNGESVSGVPGSESVAGRLIVYVGTWENRNIPIKSLLGTEEVTNKTNVSVVGLIHSRGVGRVMPVESKKMRTLEGVSSLTQRDGVCNAIH